MFDTLTRDQLHELHTVIYTGLIAMYGRLSGFSVFSSDYAVMTVWIEEQRETFDAISAEINRRNAVEAAATGHDLGGSRGNLSRHEQALAQDTVIFGCRECSRILMAREAQAAALACCEHCTHSPSHIAATRGHVFTCTACT